MDEFQTPGGLAAHLRKLIRACHRAALGTLAGEGGGPYVSLVTVATDCDGCPLLLLSKLADHTRNILGDSRVSLLFDGTEDYANPQQGPRVTLVGTIQPDQGERGRRRFLARHPSALLYAGFADFAVYRVTVERAHWVGGFGRARWLTDSLAVAPDAAARFNDGEEILLERLNRDHAALATQLAARILKRRGKGWCFTAADPDGCDLARGETVLRLAFDAPVDTIEDVVSALAGIR